MIRSLILVFAVLLLLAGCKDAAPVQVLPPGGTPDVEITPVAAADTNYVAAPVDSSAVLPADNLRFGAFLTINRITLDNGPQRSSGAYARVLFEDRLRPVRFLARRFGFHGLDLGTVELNGDPMVRVPHRIRINRILIDTVVAAGWEYLQNLSPTYEPGGVYTWTAPASDSTDAFSLSITAPPELTVQSPMGGTTVRADQPLQLRWTGTGPISIVVSGYEAGSLRLRPRFVLRPRVNTGSVVLPARVMRLLTQDRFQAYAFSFVLANRDEARSVGRFNGAVLLQAAAVYTTVVQIQ
jgi:hypothetical protein